MANGLFRVIRSWAQGTAAFGLARSKQSARRRTVLPPSGYALAVLLSGTFVSQSVVAAEATDRRQIEEVVVTAERKESTVSDTSISITAFTGDFLQDMGIRNQEDLQNYIPAAVIEPYDMAIRGVGRNFRSLGGDPGIATYLNGVYSEDFGIASTEGGLFDVDRIEVLRGPQGTLYGRNAIGGAVNFINNLPTDEFEGEARVLGGSYGLVENYEMLSGPLIKGILDARLTGTKRVRDGYVDDLSGHQNPDNYGDENYALGLRYTPTDNMEFNARGNERSYARRMGGADAAGIVNFTENGEVPDEVTGFERNTSTFAWGYRPVGATACPTLLDRTTPNCRIVSGVTAGANANPNYYKLFNFNDPVTGAPVIAQRVIAGVDPSTAPNTNSTPNQAYGLNGGQQKMLGLDTVDSEDLQTGTNGVQDEYFDQSAVSFDWQWTVNDWLSVKYIFGYTDYFYDRTSDYDLSENTNFDEQFYVSQETEYASHELQFFTDFGEDLSITTGLFAYQASITQRGDFYNSTGTGRYTQTPDYSLIYPSAANPSTATNPLGGTAYSFLRFFPKVDLFTAKKAAKAAPGSAPYNVVQFNFGQWAGDALPGDNITHGPNTPGTDLEYQTRSERHAYAAYTQGVYTFNEHFALTMGVRWARDQLHGEENLFFYNEAIFTGLPDTSFFRADGTLLLPSLAAYNQSTGALSADGSTIQNQDALRVTGVPISVSLWRRLYRKDDEVTWRINLDWTPTDKDLIYLSVTTGARAGGFNLVFFSSNESYDPENLIAYELGYKGELLDGTMQVNSALYFYDYQDVHTFGAGPSATGALSTSVFNVPKAEIVGFDTDILWLASDHLTLGLAASYTHSEYTDNFRMVNTTDAAVPGSLFDPLNGQIDIKGNQMVRIPEYKAGGYVTYNYPLRNDWGALEFTSSVSWIDNVFFSQFNLATDEADAYTRVDARFTWTSAEANWIVAAFVDNIFDEVGTRQIEAYGEDLNFRRTGSMTSPRLYGMELRYFFGAYK